MLGTDARRILAEQGHEVIPTDVGPAATGEIRPLDITDFAGCPRPCWPKPRPDVVLHGAAYTNVDGCERDPDLAHKVNALGTWAVASAAEEIGAALVAISTDFVFDGAKGSPYTEFDAPNPISHYGASKLAGENLARAACRRCYVVRTSWLYGVHGKNFPYAMIDLAKTKPELPVVADQFGTPTYTVDLVEAIAGIIETPLVWRVPCQQRGRNKLARLRAGHFCENEPGPCAGDSRLRPTSTRRCSARRPGARPTASCAIMRWNCMGKDTLRPWEEALDDFLASARAAGKI